MKMYKQIIGVKTQTTNIGVLLELRRIPLTLWAKNLRLKIGNEFVWDLEMKYFLKPLIKEHLFGTPSF